MIKQLRKLSNMTISCIISDNQLENEIGSILSEAKSIDFIKESDLDKLFELKSDIIVFEYNIDSSTIKKLSSLNPLIPKIAILKDISETNIINCINTSVVSILKYPLSRDDLQLAIMVALNRTKRADKIFLNNGYYYDAYRERFYGPKGEVALTNFEFNLLKLLVDNPTKIVSYDEIKKNVWKEKPMSIFTMRNVVNKIRKKTYQAIIKNNSSKGYQIDSKKK